jgi:hypothetical protein
MCPAIDPLSGSVADADAKKEHDKAADDQSQRREQPADVPLATPTGKVLGEPLLPGVRLVGH